MCALRKLTLTLALPNTPTLLKIEIWYKTDNLLTVSKHRPQCQPVTIRSQAANHSQSHVGYI